MFTEALLAGLGLALIAVKVFKDDNDSLRAELEFLRTKLDLAPLNDQLAQADKELQDAKKNYDNSINPNNH